MDVKNKPGEIYRITSDVLREEYFLIKIYKCAKLFKISRNRFQDSSGRLTILSILGMVDAVNAFILVDGKVRIEDISEPMAISVGTAHKTMHNNLTLSKVGSFIRITQSVILQKKKKQTVDISVWVRNNSHILLTI